MSDAIGIVPYTNMRAYALTPPPAGCELVQLSPKQMVQAFRSGALTAAAVPVGGLHELREAYAFLSAFGISARTRIGSVLLFSGRPFDQLGADASVTLSPASATSNRLLKLLLEYEQGPGNLPRFNAPGQTGDAELIIGDAALQRLHQAPGPHVIDLAQRWWARHRLPFVFARWIIRRDAPDSLRQALSGWLETVSATRDQWLPRVAREASARLGIDDRACETYLRGVHYSIGQPEQQGQQLFEQELARRTGP